MANIAVTHVKQTKTNWCWAACCEMIGGRFNCNLSQDGYALHHNTRFGHGLDHMADPGEVAWMLRNYVQLNVVAQRYIGNNADAKPTWQEVCGALDRAQLILASVSNHMYVIVGHGVDATHGNILWVHDPSREAGPSRVKWDVFAANWTATVMMSANDVHVLD
jgi:ABC-type bacteriocin/lantibiotic exporter with double-glycine peptidase domain